MPEHFRYLKGHGIKVYKKVTQYTERLTKLIKI